MNTTTLTPMRPVNNRLPAGILLAALFMLQMLNFPFVQNSFRANTETLIEIEEEIPFAQETVFDPLLPGGMSKVLQKGEAGLVYKKYALQIEKGVEKARRVLEYRIVREAQTETIAVGTKNTIIQSSRSLPAPRKAYQIYTTAYTHTGNRTFTGVYPHTGTIAVDPAVIPLGSRLWVEGYGYGIAEDTGGLIHGNIIDLFMDTKEECLIWGRKKVNVYLLQ